MASELLRLLRGEDTRLEHYLLTVDTREADIEPVKSLGPPAGEERVVDLRVGAGPVLLTGRLVADDGGPIVRARARLRFRSDDNQDATVPFTSDANGRFRLALDGYLIGTTISEGRVIELSPE